MINIVMTTLCAILLAVSPCWAEETAAFDADKAIADTQEKIKLSKEKWEQLKPYLAEKSKGLKKNMDESVARGYAELEALGQQLDAKSKEAEALLEQMTTSEEADKIRELFGKLDKEAMRSMREQTMAELTDLLKLTEEQAATLGPVFNEFLDEMSALMKQAMAEGSRNWDAFKKDFEILNQALRDQLDNSLNPEQLDRFDQYQEQQKIKIQKVMVAV